MEKIKKRSQNIKKIDRKLYDKYRFHWDSLVHPTGSFGQIELLSIKLCSIYDEIPTNLDKKCLLVYCADNGIIEENVSSSPRILTKLLAQAMANKTIGATAMMDRIHGEIHIIDLGIKDFQGDPKILDERIMNGTNNFLKKDALGQKNTIKALEKGIDLADKAIDQGARIIGLGELGMGNTTTSAAVLTALTGQDAKNIVGPGSGVDPVQYQNKIQAVEDGIKLRKVDRSDSFDIVSKVSGLDIAAMLGTILAAASRKIPIVLDGIITIAAAALAYNINEHVVDYIIPSHIPAEPGARIGLDYMGLEGYLKLDMRLGEGAGTGFMMSLLEDSLYLMRNMTKFEETQIENTLYNIRDEG